MNKLHLNLLRLAISLGLLVPVLSPVAARAGECGVDPVYTKSAVGVTDVGLRIRDIACMEGSKVLTVVPAGTEVQVIGETDGWYKVKYEGKTGWMGATLMTIKSSKEVKKEALVEKKETMKTAEIGKKNMIGILERDYKTLEKGDKALAARLKDKVLLRVQNKGETWYVETDGSLTRVKMYGKNEFKRMTSESKKGAKETKVETKKVVELPPAGSITLKVEMVGGKVKLSWVANVDAPNGFKVVKSTEPNPSYPNDSAEYVDANTRSREWALSGGKTYHIRVCRYTGNGCDSYSNDVEIFVPAVTVEKEVTKTSYNPIDGELKLEAATLPGAVALSWSKRTSDGFDGYKIVRSTTNADLSYPNDGYIEFLPNRESLTHIDGTAIPGKTYYYRICAREAGSVASCGNVVKVVARQR